MGRTLILNKPFGVLSKFTDEAGRPTLADYVEVSGVYAAGRLDKDSEGLIVLTSDGPLQHRLSSPKYSKKKGYWVQVEGTAQPEAIDQLRRGVTIRGYKTKPAQVREISKPLTLWERIPPIRERKAIPTSWLELYISEGKNRQVRRMTASVGLPTLRLIRFSVDSLSLDGLGIGEWREVSSEEITHV
jgi:23S rRNA pseudouridine2457 synthase